MELILSESSSRAQREISQNLNKLSELQTGDFSFRFASFEMTLLFLVCTSHSDRGEESPEIEEISHSDSLHSK